MNHRSVYDGRLLHVWEDEIRLPSGRQARREVVEHPGAVCIVARPDADHVVLVRQWRHPLGRAIWELPAGTREPGEAPELCAERELAEETGFQAAEWTLLCQCHVAPGYSTEEIFFFAASGLTAGTSHPDTDETLDVRVFDSREIRDMIAAGTVDMKTIAGLALARFTLLAEPLNV